MIHHTRGHHRERGTPMTLIWKEGFEESWDRPAPFSRRLDVDHDDWDKQARDRARRISPAIHDIAERFRHGLVEAAKSLGMSFHQLGLLLHDVMEELERDREKESRDEFVKAVGHFTLNLPPVLKAEPVLNNGIHGEIVVDIDVADLEITEYGKQLLRTKFREGGAIPAGTAMAYDEKRGGWSPFNGEIIVDQLKPEDTVTVVEQINRVFDRIGREGRKGAPTSKCDECFGTGLKAGFQAPCSKGCKS